MTEFITKRVHELYWEKDINCARTMLTCLSELFEKDLCEETMHAAIGLHGAGGFRAQCGLVEGTIMFIGVFFSEKGASDSAIAGICYEFAEAFTNHFLSLSCKELRPNGFTENDPPHACEKLTTDAVTFSYAFIQNKL